MVRVVAAVALCCAAGSLNAQTARSRYGPKPGQLWKAIVFAPNEAGFVDSFARMVDEVLLPAGINIVVFDMHWRNFPFESRPELAALPRPKDHVFSKAEYRRCADLCRRKQIRVMVGMNCLSHQNHGFLLDAFPGLAEPGDPRAWCPTNPDVNPIVFGMMDELIDTFRADGFHVGMDEAWGFYTCPRCRQQDPAALFAKVVKDMHSHLVLKRRVEMLMWGDMLLDWHGKDTKRSADMIPKDIVICDWHYDQADDYPSIRFFLDKGFRVLPSGWQGAGPTTALVESAQRDARPGMLGHLYTTWCGRLAQDLPPAFKGEGDQSKLDGAARGVAEAIRSTAGKVSPVGSGSVEFLTRPVAGQGRLTFAAGVVGVRHTVLNDGNFGCAVVANTQRLELQSLDGRKVQDVGETKSGGRPSVFKLSLPPGDYRLVAYGKARVARKPFERQYVVYGRPFRVAPAP